MNGLPGVPDTRSADGRDRFWSKVENIGNCWVWTGAMDKFGYGCFNYRGRTSRAHRVAYELANGPIPDGLELDHLCRNRYCVNPAHLEPVTFAENQRRRAMAVTECPKGHPYDEANTYNGPRGRNCRACNAEAQMRYQARKARP